MCNEKSIFPLFRGSGGQIKFLIEKNTWKNIGTVGLVQGKILGRLAFHTWVVCPSVCPSIVLGLMCLPTATVLKI